METIRVEVVPDDRSGAGKLSDVIRIKKYYKEPEDAEVFGPIPEVACASLPRPLTFEDTNNVAVVDLVGCDQKCWWCYQQGRSVETTEWEPHAIAEEFLRVAHGVPAWRVSGGEPTLQPAIMDLINELLVAAGDDHIVWLNTNGYDMSRIPDPDWGRLFIEVSAKGLTPELYHWNSPSAAHGNPVKVLGTLLSLGHQTFLNACSLVPADWTPEQSRAAMVGFCDSLAQIHRGLPLTIIWIRPKHYEWLPDWPANRDARDDFDLWLMDQDYTVAELMTPVWLLVRKIAHDIGGDDI